MKTLRLIYRIVALSAITLGCYLILEAGNLILSGTSSIKLLWRSRVLRLWSRLSCLVLSLKINASVPAIRAPFFLASNHLSYVDIIVLGSRLPCLFVAKKDVANWPIIGRLCKSAGTIFIDRDKRGDVYRVNQLIKHALACGCGVVLFPEGTSSPGESVLKFNSSLLEQGVGHPMRYCALTYEVDEDDPPASNSVCWWGTMSFGSHFLGLLRLRRINASMTVGRRTLVEQDRKVLARALWSAVNEIFTPTARGERFITSDATAEAAMMEGQCNTATV